MKRKIFTIILALSTALGTTTAFADTTSSQNVINSNLNGYTSCTDFINAMTLTDLYNGIAKLSDIYILQYDTLIHLSATATGVYSKSDIDYAKELANTIKELDIAIKSMDTCLLTLKNSGYYTPDELKEVEGCLTAIKNSRNYISKINTSILSAGIKGHAIKINEKEQQKFSDSINNTNTICINAYDNMLNSMIACLETNMQYEN